MTTLYLCFISLAAFVVSFVLNKILLKFSSNLGVRNNQISILRWSEQSKPSVGGISFFIVFLIVTLFYSIAVPGVQDDTLKIMGIVLSLFLAFIMGLSDDAYNTTPILKFLVQLLCGILLVITDTYIQVFHYEYLNYVLTVFWVIGLMNSINMLDNMDGITTITSIIILFSCVLFDALFLSNTGYFPLLLLSTISSLLAFLYFNWNPSKMFMGDTGSQFLGVLLAVAGIEYVWNLPLNYAQNDFFFTFTFVFLVFLVPITDTTAVSINRLLRGQSPFVGGRDHTTHFLSYLGLTDAQVAIVIASIGLVASISAYALITIPSTFIVYGITVLNILISIALYMITKTVKLPKNTTINQSVKSERVNPLINNTTNTNRVNEV